ncbi:MAG: peptidase [Desulfobacteraceae bacterium]|nr:MAG: peptidase [Desulfobacteraceae bacterium]
MVEKKPLLLMADSQLLFWKKGDDPFIKTFLADDADRPELKAAYIGAANGDQPEYFDIFKAAMEQLPGARCRMIISQPDAEDEKFLDESDVILLAGGDVELGMQVMQANGIWQRIIPKYYTGTLIVGVSAGAVQLGLKGWRNPNNGDRALIDTFKLVPYVIDVHAEAENWESLGKAVRETGPNTTGFGIPFGAGLVLHPDWSLEAVRHPVTEISFTGEEIKQSLILPS